MFDCATRLTYELFIRREPKLAMKTTEMCFKNNAKKQAELKTFSARWLHHWSATMQERIFFKILTVSTKLNSQSRI